MKFTKLNISIGVLIIFHLVGLLGIIFLETESFLRLTPANLLLTLVFILLNHQDWTKWWVFALTFLGGFLIEVVGVNMGWPFGEYEYGSVLGPKLWSTPLMIGVNWLILLYGANCIGNMVGLTAVTKALTAAALMTFLDYFIEPVAIEYHFWNWSNATPPLANYLSWFVVAFLLSLLFQLAKIRLNQTFGIAVFLVECSFFVVLFVQLGH